MVWNCQWKIVNFFKPSSLEIVFVASSNLGEVSKQKGEPTLRAMYVPHETWRILYRLNYR